MSRHIYCHFNLLSFQKIFSCLSLTRGVISAAMNQAGDQTCVMSSCYIPALTDFQSQQPQPWLAVIYTRTHLCAWMADWGESQIKFNFALRALKKKHSWISILALQRSISLKKKKLYFQSWDGSQDRQTGSGCVPSASTSFLCSKAVAAPPLPAACGNLQSLYFNLENKELFQPFMCWMTGPALSPEFPLTHSLQVILGCANDKKIGFDLYSFE